MIISIVGGGATGITMLRHLAELACSGRYRNLVTAIGLFDKSGFDGGLTFFVQFIRRVRDQYFDALSEAVLFLSCRFLPFLQVGTLDAGQKVSVIGQTEEPIDGIIAFAWLLHDDATNSLLMLVNHRHEVAEGGAQELSQPLLGASWWRAFQDC